MYLLPIYFCLFSFIISSFLGKFLSNKGSIFMNILSIFISLVISFFIFYEVGLLHINCYLNLFSWFYFSNINIYWSFVFDSLSSTMLIVILFVSFCANFYSIEYMMYDPHKIRFFSYLSLFTFTMMMLVTSNNLLQLFFGWESVGVSSYLLINFWYTRIQANKSSILAIMANKIGDILLLFSCLFLLFKYNSLSFNNIFFLSNLISNQYYFDSNFFQNSLSIDFLNSNNSVDYLFFNQKSINQLNYINLVSIINLNTVFLTSNFICFFIILASICKSAQSGFHFWLAEAMEGPTPVSSLLHAATMVTAGIYLTVRCSFLFNFVFSLPIFIIFIGAITSFFSSLIGVTQYDLKKIVAYSTCSQLGYMFLSNGIFSYNFTMFHLFNHAFFKALLFLSSGYIIHLVSNEQDLRKMGGLLKIIPLPYICLVIGSFSLMGIPYFSGFFSKDTIIENFYNLVIINSINLEYYNIIFFCQILLSISIFFTIFYSIKLIYYVFLNSFNGFYYYLIFLHFSGYFMIIPLLLLSFFSLFSGFLFSDMMIGISSFYWNNSIDLNYFNFDKLLVSVFKLNFYLLPYEFNKFVYYFVFFNSIYLIFFSYILYRYFFNYLYFFSLGSSKYFFYFFININKKVLFFNRLIINSILFLFFKESYQNTYKLLDKNIFEIIGPFGIVFNIKNIFLILNIFSTGLLYHYLGIILLFLLYNFYYFI